MPPFCWKTDFRGLSNITTVLMVIDIIVIFLPYVPGLSYSAKGMTGWIQIPLIHLTFQPVELVKKSSRLYQAVLMQYNGESHSV